MATSTKEYLIKTVYDSTGLQKFSKDVDNAKAAALSLGLKLSESAKVIDTSVTSSFNKAGKSVRDVTTTFEDFGKRTSVSFRSVAGEISSSSLSMTKDFSNFAQTAGQKVLTLTIPLAGLAAKLTTLQSLNRTFGQTFGASFKAGSEIVDNASEKLSQRKVSFQGKEALVPVQQLSTVVKTAEGDFQKLNQTILTMPNGVKQITRSMTDVSASYKKAATAALELSQASKEVALNVAKVSLSTEQAERGARFFSSGLSRSATLTDISSKSFNRAGQETLRTTAIFNDNGKKITTVFDSMGSSTAKVSQTMGALKENVAKADIDLGKLISRAAVTIPVWFALRAAITGVFQGISGGTKNILDFDAALQKLRGNLDGTSAETKATLGSLKQEFTDLSLKTGVSAVEIANAFQKFATVGFGVKESLSGAVGATKLSIAFFGDAVETANAFARGLRVLVDQSHGTAESQRQIGEAMALTSELWKKNAFEIDEMNQGLEKFSAVAQTSKISMKETLVLLATMGTAAVGGARGGTLLRTSFQNLVQNIGEVSKQLGIQVNPQFDSTFTVLTKVIDALSKLDANSALTIERTGVMAKVFGGVRGSLPIQALVAMNDLLKENMKYTGDMATLNNRVADVLNSESGQAKILNNAMVELGKSFVTGLTGAKDFTEALKSINNYVAVLKPTLNGLAANINTLFTSTPIGEFVKLTNTYVAAVDRMDKKSQESFERIVSGLNGKLSKVDLTKLQLDFKEGTLKLPKNLNTASLAKALSTALSSEEVASTKAKIPVEPTINIRSEAIRSLENELAELKARLKAKGATDIQLSLLDVDFLKTQVGQEARLKERDEKSKIQIKTIEQQVNIQNELIKAIGESAKAEGATNLEVLIQREELEKSLGIKRTGMELLNQQLELQRALTEETKKTREERLKELETLVKKTASPFQSNFSGEMRLDSRERTLRNQASMRGISDDQVNKILNPESQIKQGNSLLRDLQMGLTNPMTKSMGSLESAISSLTQTILQQETVSTGASVPTWNFNANKSSEITKPGSKLNKAVQQVVEEF